MSACGMRLASRFSVKAGRIIMAGISSPQRTDLQAALEFEGHQVVEAETADQTLEGTCSGEYHVLLVSSGFGGIAPHELCRAIRLKSDLGIIVLGSQDDTRQARIDALNAGADDYVPTPFVMRELLARARAVLRRVNRADDERQILLHDRAIDLKSYEIRGPGSRVSHLTPKEFMLLRCLVAQPNKAFTHQRLAQTVWQRDGGGEVEYLRVVIRQLRRKLEPDPDNPRYILTERSVGYRFDLPSQLALAG